MRSGRIVLFLTVLLLVAFARAFAQSPAPTLEIFLEGGGSLSNTGSGTETLIAPYGILACPTSGCPPALSVRMTNSFSKTVHPIVGARYRFMGRNAVEASYSYSPYHFVVQPAGEFPLAGYNRADQVSFNYVRYLSVKARVQPFLTAGLGVNRFSGSSGSSAVEAGYIGAENGWQRAWNFGGGADLVLGRNAAVRMELRDYVTGQPSIITGTSHNVVPSVGFVFRFK